MWFLVFTILEGNKKKREKPAVKGGRARPLEVRWSSIWSNYFPWRDASPVELDDIYSSWSRGDATSAMDHPFLFFRHAWLMAVKATLLATHLQRSYRLGGWYWHWHHVHLKKWMDAFNHIPCHGLKYYLLSPYTPSIYSQYVYMACYNSARSFK